MSRLLCAIFGHKYIMLKRFSNTARLIGCSCCKERWGMNDRVKALVAWDGELADIYGEEYP